MTMWFGSTKSLSLLVVCCPLLVPTRGEFFFKIVSVIAQEYKGAKLRKNFLFCKVAPTFRLARVRQLESWRYAQVLNSPKKMASQTRPLAKKNKKPATPSRRNHAFQSFFSMFGK
jgi:hypothetical protein